MYKNLECLVHKVPKCSNFCPFQPFFSPTLPGGGGGGRDGSTNQENKGPSILYDLLRRRRRKRSCFIAVDVNNNRDDGDDGEGDNGNNKVIKKKISNLLFLPPSPKRNPFCPSSPVLPKFCQPYATNFERVYGALVRRCNIMCTTSTQYP